MAFSYIFHKTLKRVVVACGFQGNNRSETVQKTAEYVTFRDKRTQQHKYYKAYSLKAWNISS